MIIQVVLAVTHVPFSRALVAREKLVIVNFVNYMEKRKGFNFKTKSGLVIYFQRKKNKMKKKL